MVTDLYDDADDDDANYDIIESGKDRFETAFQVPNVFYGLIVGAKGTTRKRIETETKTTVRIPRTGIDGDVEIFGLTRKGVAAARRRIDLIVIGARHKHITHFVCVPIFNSEIRTNFEKFMVCILKTSKLTKSEPSLV